MKKIIVSCMLSIIFSLPCIVQGCSEDCAQEMGTTTDATKVKSLLHRAEQLKNLLKECAAVRAPREGTPAPNSPQYPVGPTVEEQLEVVEGCICSLTTGLIRNLGAIEATMNTIEAQVMVQCIALEE